MKFTKLEPDSDYMNILTDPQDEAVAGWVSEGQIYAIVLSNHKERSIGSNWDNIWFYTLKALDDAHDIPEKVQCTVYCDRDGVSAFVIEEMKRIISEHACDGAQVVVDSMCKFMGAIGGRPQEVRGQVFSWAFTNLMSFQKYKEQQV